MVRLFSFAIGHRGKIFGLLVLLTGAIAGLYRVSRMDEGQVRHVKKQLNEARLMPGRLLT